MDKNFHDWNGRAADFHGSGVAHCQLFSGRLKRWQHCCNISLSAQDNINKWLSSTEPSTPWRNLRPLPTKRQKTRVLSLLLLLLLLASYSLLPIRRDLYQCYKGVTEEGERENGRTKAAISSIKNAKFNRWNRLDRMPISSVSRPHWGARFFPFFPFLPIFPHFKSTTTGAIISERLSSQETADRLAASAAAAAAAAAATAINLKAPNQFHQFIQFNQNLTWSDPLNIFNKVLVSEKGKWSELLMKFPTRWYESVADRSHNLHRSNQVNPIISSTRLIIQNDLGYFFNKVLVEKIAINNQFHSWTIIRVVTATCGHSIRV